MTGETQVLYCLQKIENKGVIHISISTGYFLLLNLVGEKRKLNFSISHIQHFVFGTNIRCFLIAGCHPYWQKFIT